MRISVFMLNASSEIYSSIL